MMAPFGIGELVILDDPEVIDVVFGLILDKTKSRVLVGFETGDKRWMRTSLLDKPEEYESFRGHGAYKLTEYFASFDEECPVAGPKGIDYSIITQEFRDLIPCVGSGFTGELIAPSDGFTGI